MKTRCNWVLKKRISTGSKPWIYKFRSWMHWEILFWQTCRYLWLKRQPFIGQRIKTFFNLTISTHFKIATEGFLTIFQTVLICNYKPIIGKIINGLTSTIISPWVFLKYCPIQEEC